jgi:serine-type D-Ala-D-Ala carboxypeptidase (penicillin-binding protein 5/6)
MKKISIFITVILVTLSSGAYSIDTTAKQAILIDFNSGEVLFKKNEDHKISPASLTKIMTSIVAFDLIKKGQLKLDEKIIISTKAWRMSKQGYSSMFIMPNDKITVENLLKGIIIASGNDACIALAEGIAGSEESFAIMMNEKAKDIGMKNTNFSNASGIFSGDNYSTVADVGMMSVHLIKNYPDLYKIYSEKSFTWDRTGGKPIAQSNRNSLLYRNSNVDGIKTGHLSDSGFALAASMKNGERRLVSVVSGTASNAERTRESLKLLNYAVITTDLIKIKKDNPLLVAEFWNGKTNQTQLHLKEDVFFAYSKRKSRDLNLTISIEQPIKKQFKINDELGQLKVEDKNGFSKKYTLYASENYTKINFIRKFINTINFLVWG